MRDILRRFFRESDGGTMIEYALLASMLAIAVVAAVQSIGVEVNQSFTNAEAAIESGNALAP